MLFSSAVLASAEEESPGGTSFIPESSSQTLLQETTETPPSSDPVVSENTSSEESLFPGEVPSPSGSQASTPGSPPQEESQNAEDKLSDLSQFSGRVVVATPEESEAGELQGVNGIEVQLQRWDSQQWRTEQTTVTQELDGVSGLFSFSDLQPDPYRVEVVLDESEMQYQPGQVELTMQRGVSSLNNISHDDEDNASKDEPSDNGEANTATGADQSSQLDAPDESDNALISQSVTLKQGDAAYVDFSLVWANYINGGSINLSTLRSGDKGPGWTYSNSLLTFDSGMATIPGSNLVYTISGNMEPGAIRVAHNTVISLRLEGISIRSFANKLDPAFSVGTGSHVSLELADGSINWMDSSYNETLPGLYIEKDGWVMISGDTGHLVVMTGSSSEAAGIGAYGNHAAGHLVMHSGRVSVLYGLYGAGIGGGKNTEASMQSITVYGGLLDVKPRNSANVMQGAAIGGGVGGGITDHIMINGGKINASGYTGIGGTKGGAVSSIVINDGQVTALGYVGPGIGSLSSMKRIDITGGTIEATSHITSGQGAGIGTGNSGDIDAIRISGGKVTAKGQSPFGGAGIGTSGDSSSHIGLIAISNGTINATGGATVQPSRNPALVSGPGIGAGGHGHIDNIAITGGTIRAEAGKYASAGIGAGDSRFSVVDTLSISGGTVTAIGSSVLTELVQNISKTSGGGVAIGNGGNGAVVNNLYIDGGTIYALNNSKTRKAIEANGGNKGQAYILNLRFAFTQPSSQINIRLFRVADGAPVLDLPYRTTVQHPAYTGLGTVTGTTGDQVYATQHLMGDAKPNFRYVNTLNNDPYLTPTQSGQEEITINQSAIGAVLPPYARDIDANSATIVTPLVFFTNGLFSSANFMLSTSPDMDKNVVTVPFSLANGARAAASAKVTGLQSNTKYYIKAKVVTTTETLTTPVTSNGPFFITAPDIQNFKAENIQVDSITLTGTIGKSMTDTPITGLELRYATSPEALEKTPQVITVPPKNSGDSPDTYYTDTDFRVFVDDLEPGTRYYFKALLQNGGSPGNTGGKSLDATTLNGSKPYAITTSAEPKIGGEVTADKAKAIEGENVKLTATPKDGYYLKEWKVIAGGPLVIRPGGNFTMPKNKVSVVAVFAESRKMLNVSIPTKLLFTSSPMDKGSLQSPEYTITNLSSLGLEVSLDKFAITNNMGLTLVTGESPPQTGSDNQLWLGLETGGADNRAPAKLGGIGPGNPPPHTLLGSLGSGQPQPQKMTMHLTGRYYGSYDQRRSPQYNMVLHFKPFSEL